VKTNSNIPPRLATRLLRSFLRGELQEEVIGDLKENFDFDVDFGSLRRARVNYWKQVLLYLRPFAIKKIKGAFNNPTMMYKNYLRVAIQNMVKNKLHTFINTSGLAIGMAVAIIISLWVHDELSYNKQFTNYQRIGQVIQNVTNNGEVQTWRSIPWPLGEELRRNYGSDFQYISMASNTWDRTITIDKEKFSRQGIFVEPDFLKMYDVQLIAGSYSDKDPSAVLLSESTANAFFGESNPVGKMIGMDGTMFQVSGVYPDFPKRSTWNAIHFIGHWSTYARMSDLEGMEDPWRPNAFTLLVMLADQSTFQGASARIKDAKLKNVNDALKKKKPELFIHAMDDWRLRSEFRNGVQTGGLIQYVWMFGIVGVFVLLMACINFMNLSTARSEKRAKEVGIRKAVGSYRSQLIAQFFSESILITFVSLLLAVVLAHLMLPLFNTLSEKEMSLPWSNVYMWLSIVVASIIVGVIAGSYPALYLSGIRPVGALKGVFKNGRGASAPRRILVVVQFTVSVIMIIGTSTVFLQIQHGRNRPLGFNVNGLVSIPNAGEEAHQHFDAIRKTLIDNASIVEMTESASPATNGWSSSSRIEWDGKDPDLSIDFSVFEGSYEYGKTIQWEVLQGRDFSREFPSDSSAVIVNETVVSYLDKKDVIGETIRANGGQVFTIVGVVKDVAFGDPYQPTKPSLYFLSQRRESFFTFRLNPAKSATESLANIEGVLKPYLNGEPFNYIFLDEDQEQKFANERRVSTLASIFATLAIFISCLGIFGLSSFVAEQRMKEIGVRKVLGANLSQLWILMSKDFVILVTISCIIASPLAAWLLQSWLDGYSYRIELPYWIFIGATAATLIVTLLTVSWHMIKAARVSPVRTLKVE
jgi:putative ABC transport system permease protein